MQGDSSQDGAGAIEQRGLHLLQYESHTVETSTLGARSFVIYHKRFERGMLTLPCSDKRTDNYRIMWRKQVLIVVSVELERIRSRMRYDISLSDSANSTRISL